MEERQANTCVIEAVIIELEERYAVAEVKACEVLEHVSKVPSINIYSRHRVKGGTQHTENSAVSFSYTACDILNSSLSRSPFISCTASASYQ